MSRQQQISNADSKKAKKKHATVHSTASPSHRNRDADAPVDLTTVV
jgi:hypothetical protein